MSAVTKRESARLDLVEHYMYLAENASADVTRFANLRSSNLRGFKRIGIYVPDDF